MASRFTVLENFETLYWRDEAELYGDLGQLNGLYHTRSKFNARMMVRRDLRPPAPRHVWAKHFRPILERLGRLVHHTRCFRHAQTKAPAAILLQPSGHVHPREVADAHQWLRRYGLTLTLPPNPLASIHCPGRALSLLLAPTGLVGAWLWLPEQLALPLPWSGREWGVGTWERSGDLDDDFEPAMRLVRETHSG